MALLKKSACSTNTTATCDATETALEIQYQPGEIPAICVDYIDHGERETPWGLKPQVDLVFERVVNGSPKWFTRTYNNFPYSKSALAIDFKNWLGRDISDADQDWDRTECIGEQATLKMTEALSKTGNQYKKIASVNPSGEIHVQESGTYERHHENV